MAETAIKFEHVKKEYRLGQIGGGTLKGDLQSWAARIRGKEDPNSLIGNNSNKKIGDRFLALNDITFEVKKGEALGIIGHNGAGKSTLLKLLSRVTAPSDGTISYNGRIASMLEVGTGFHPEMTGRENIYMNGAILGMTKAEIDAKMEDIIEFSEVRQFIDTPVKRYSSGMYVKLAFSVAAHLDSEIMIMDEVLAVGDMAFQKKCLTKMREAAKYEGRTVLYVSHNMNTIRQLCDRCIVLDKGKVIFDGDVEDAIELYLANSDVPQTVMIDYKDVPRLGWLSYNTTKIKTLETGFIDKDNIVFGHGEKIKLFIEWLNETDIKSISLRIELLQRDRTPIGSTVLCDFDSGVKDQKGSVNCELDVSYLVDGEYALTYVFFERDEFGNMNTIDCVHGLFFEIKDNRNTDVVWDERSFGNIRFPEIKIIEKE